MLNLIPFIVFIGLGWLVLASSPIGESRCYLEQPEDLSRQWDACTNEEVSK